MASRLLILLLAALTACTLSPAEVTTTSPTTAATTTTIDASASDACATLRSLPYPERRIAFDDLAGRDEGSVDALRRECPDIPETLEDLDRLVEASAQLDDERRAETGFENLTCGSDAAALEYTNPFDVSIRLLVFASFTRASGGAVSVFAAVSDPVEPGATTAVSVPLVGSGPGVSCQAGFQPFLHDPTSDATDTWTAAPDAELPLPDAATDDWQRTLQELIDYELAVLTEGRWTVAGGLEDVRSKNYRDLTEREGIQQAESVTVQTVCRVDRVGDDTATVYFVEELQGDKALVVGVFRRSPQDGRWRWLMTGELLAFGSEAGCGLLSRQAVTA